VKTALTSRFANGAFLFSEIAQSVSAVEPSEKSERSAIRRFFLICPEIAKNRLTLLLKSFIMVLPTTDPNPLNAEKGNSS